MLPTTLTTHSKARRRGSVRGCRQLILVPLALAGLLSGNQLLLATPVSQAQTIPANSAPDDSNKRPPTAAPDLAPAWAGTLELYGFLPIRTTGSTTVKGFTATEPPPDAVTGFGEGGTVVGVWSPEESCACWEPVTVRTLSALAGVVLLLSTLVFPMAAADPAVRTPTSERTVIARFCTS